jgi:hypothetical protein
MGISPNPSASSMARISRSSSHAATSSSKIRVDDGHEFGSSPRQKDRIPSCLVNNGSKTVPGVGNSYV